MVSIEQVVYVVPLLALAASLFYNALNLRTANKNQKMQLETRQAQLFINIYNQTLNNQPTRDAHKIMSTWKWSSFEEFSETLFESENSEKNMDALLLIGAFYNGVGILVKEKLLDIRYVDTMAFWITMFWRLLDPYIDELRAKTYPKLFNETEYLYKELMKYRKEHPETAT
jgi:hypothetical protein